jgi:GntR family histidine utilization transcriptional repressor
MSSNSPVGSSAAPAPAYSLVKAFIRDRISSGEWKPGDPVPSEAALVEQFHVSRMTVNRALRELSTEGLVTRAQGSGTRVAQLHRISSTLRIRDVQEEVAERGHVHSARVLTVERLKANVGVARSLVLRTGALVFHTTMLHLENGVPIQCEDRYVNPAAAPGYLEADFSLETPTHYLLKHAPLTQASYAIEACRPTPQEAAWLAIAPDEPCLAMIRRTVSGPHVASLVRLIYPGSRYSFTGDFQP